MVQSTAQLRTILAAIVMASAVTLTDHLARADDRPGQEVAAVDMDAPPVPESGAPDPLTPKSIDHPAPRAPGAPSEAPALAATTETADPTVAAVRNHSAAWQLSENSGDKADLTAARDFYATRSDALWASTTGLNDRARQVVGEISHADDWGLQATAFHLPAPLSAAPATEALADAEIKLSLAILKYARHARGGRLEPSSVSRKFDQKPPLFEPMSVLQGIAAADSPSAYLQSLHPTHVQFHKLREALVVARQAAPDTGTNAPSIAQILANMERWRWMPADLGPFYVWDSLPEQYTSVYDGGKEVLREKIVVGKLSSPTPIFSADMQLVIFHPSWGVPPGMKANELWPALRNSGGGWFSDKPLASSVLRARGLQVTRAGGFVDPDHIDWNAVNIQSYEFQQASGPQNVLGAVKFRFPNRHDVYMHDTPERNLFSGSVRAFSHGCMRVQNPMHLAEVLLSHDKGWSLDKIKIEERHGGEVKLTTPIPVHITYFTLTVDEAGTLHQYPDIYGLDSRVASALEGHAVQVASAVTGADGGLPTVRHQSSPRRQRAHFDTKSAGPKSSWTYDWSGQ